MTFEEQVKNPGIEWRGKPFWSGFYDGLAVDCQLMGCPELIRVSAVNEIG